jgi:sigma-B regulation protein RsbU (phosphoserine phosphatase)
MPGDGQVGVVIADVSGNGFPAAFFMVLSKFVIQAQALSGKSISDVLRDANNMLIANSRSGMFVTLFSGLLHYPKREAVYSNGGPSLPLLFRADENGLESLEVMGMALGLAGDMSHQARSARLEI